MKKYYKFISAIFISAFCSKGCLWAASNSLYSALPEKGRVSFWGTGSEQAILGLDGMQPLYGNKERFIYGDFMADGATDSTFLISPGLGYRQVYNNQIFGAYFFGDYEKVSLGENFWVLSPGIEWIGTEWDSHLNGYFPTTRQQQMGNTIFLSDTGDYSQISFEDGTHNQYDDLVTPFDVIGNGVDAEVGYSFSTKDNLRSRIYVGGYYYQPPSDTDVDDVTGVTAGFEQAVSDNFSITLFNSYDQVNLYAVGVNLKLTFGGESNLFSHDVHTRLLDTVERHVGIIDTGAGTYDQESFENVGTGLQYDNIWFFSPDGTGDGTYGNPAALEQSTLDLINAEMPNSSRLYIQGGEDSTYYVDSTTGGSYTSAVGIWRGLVTYSGQDFYGRSADYTAPAEAGEQPVIQVNQNDYSGFITTDGENTFSDLSITSGNTAGTSGLTGIYSMNDTINVDTVNIFGFNNQDMIVYNPSYDAKDTEVNITSSTFSSGSSGLQVRNEGDKDIAINIDNSTFSQNKNAGAAIRNTGTGQATVNIIDSHFDSNTSTGLRFVNTSSAGTVASIKNSTFDNNAVNSTTTETNAGLSVNNSSSGTFTLDVDNSEFNGNGVVTSGGTETSPGFGMYISNSGNATMNVSVTNSDFESNGVVEDGGTVTAPTSVGGAGMSIINTSTNSLEVTNLSGSYFCNNENYGLYVIGNATGTTVVNYKGAIFGTSASQTNTGGNQYVIWKP